MSNSYEMFSETIENIDREPFEWLMKVLTFENAEEDPGGLFELLDIFDDGADLYNWPHFLWRLTPPDNWSEEKAVLWIRSEDDCNLCHVQIVVEALIKKFMPDLVFELSGAITCDKMRPREFGGMWMVITDKYIRRAAGVALHEVPGNGTECHVAPIRADG